MHKLSKKEILDIIKLVFLDTIKKDSFAPFPSNEEETVKCIICKRTRPKYYYSNYDMEVYIDKYNENNPSEFKIRSNDKNFITYPNYYELIYYSVIDDICNGCMNSQSLLPEDSFYEKMYKAVIREWRIVD